MSWSKHRKRKKRRKAKQDLQNWEACNKVDRHHDLARSRGGNGNEFNIYYWDIISHRAYHALFGTRTLLETAQWLLYIHEMKQIGINVELRRSHEQVSLL
jgi:hypothetical protein